MDTRNADETRSSQSAGYAEWVMAAECFINSTDDHRERVTLTPSIKRSLRTKKPNRTKKPSNAAKVNAKRTKQAAKRAKHNDPNNPAAPARSGQATGSPCGYCDGTGEVDSGGVTPWDTPIFICCGYCNGTGKQNDAPDSKPELSDATKGDAK